MTSSRRLWTSCWRSTSRTGVDELDAEKLSPLLKLRYGALNDAIQYLGEAEQIRQQVFVGFQRYLYEPNTERLSS